MHASRNTLAASLFLLVSTSCLFTACRKEADDIQNPTACFTADKTEVEVDEPVVFVNCSQSDEAYITFTPEGEEATGISFQFNGDGTFDMSFSESGNWVVCVFAQNNQPGSTIDTIEKVITVH